MANDTLGASFSIDTTALKAGLAQANRLIRESESEFKAAAAGMEDWTKSQEGLEAKIKSLNSITTVQQKKVDALTKEYEDLIADGLDPTSAEAIKLRTQINNEQAALDKNKKALAEQTSALQELTTETVDTSNAFDKLSAEVNQQEADLKALKSEYSAIAIEQGSSSQAAQELANKISSLSTELGENKSKLNDAKTAADKFDTSIDDAGEAAEESANGGFTVMKGMIADLASGLISDIGGQVKDLASDLLQADSSLAAATGASGDELDQLNDAMENLYKGNYGESMGDLADKIAKVKQSTKGLSGDQIEGMTKNLIGLEDTFDMDFNETLRGVNNLMTHFGLSADEAFNLMAAGAQNGLNYTDELGDNISEYGGNFEQAGYSADEYFQLLQNGTQGGAYNLDKVNDSINEVKNRLGDGTIEKNIKMFSGGTQEAFKNWQNGKGTMKDVIDSIVGDISGCKDEQDALNMAATAFGTMGEDANLNVVKSLTTVGDNYSNVKGKMDEVNDTKYDNPISQLQELGRTITTELVDPLVNKLTPAIESVTQGAKDAIDWAKENQGILIAIATAIGIITVALGLQSAAQAISAAMTATQTTSIWGLVAAKLASAAATMAALAPYLLIAAAIAALIAVIVLCVKHWDKIKEAGAKAWEKIKESWQKAGEWFKGIVDKIKNAFSGIGDWFKNIFSKAWNGITSAFSKVGSFFGGIWDTIKSKFTSIGTKVADAIGGAFKSAINSVLRTVEASINLVPKTINKALGLINKLPGVEIGKMPTISLPRLATGGVVRRATNAIIGEDGAEAIVPLEKNTGWIDKVADKVADKIGGGSGVVVNQTNNYSQAHSRYEIYKSKQQTVNAVRLAMGKV